MHALLYVMNAIMLTLINYLRTARNWTNSGVKKCETQSNSTVLNAWCVRSIPLLQVVNNVSLLLLLLWSWQLGYMYLKRSCSFACNVQQRRISCFSNINLSLWWTWQSQPACNACLHWCSWTPRLLCTLSIEYNHFQRGQHLFCFWVCYGAFLFVYTKLYLSEQS